MAQPTHFADFACVVTDIDRKEYGRRIAPMKVLMLGMGRTETECMLTMVTTLWRLSAVVVDVGV